MATNGRVKLYKYEKANSSQSLEEFRLARLVREHFSIMNYHSNDSIEPWELPKSIDLGGIVANRHDPRLQL